MTQWDRETAVEALRQLDSQRLEAGIMEPLTARIIHRHSGDEAVPSMHTIGNYIGSMDDLQSELGRVTTKIALSWSDETWTDNAHWADAVLEDTGITKLTEREVAMMAKAGLMPNMRAINMRWGSIIDYRRETGVEKNSFYFEVLDWNREKHLRQGLVFAEYLGREIGFPIMPTEKSLILGAQQRITGTPRQTKNVFGTIDRYQEELGFVTTAITRRWSDQQWLENYWWLKAIWHENVYEIVSLRKFLTQAAALHIGPSPDATAEKWGTLTEYGLFVGRESNQHKRILPKEGLLRAAIQHVNKFGEPLNKENLAESGILSPDMATRHFGGIHALNLRLGIISGALGWNNNKMLWWAVTAFMPETGELPTRGKLEQWSAANRGPSFTKAESVFGGLKAYKNEVVFAQQWMEGQVWKLDALRHNGDIGLDADIVRLAIRRNPDLFHPGQDINVDELEPLVRLKQAGVHMRTIVTLMNTGISFSHPRSQLNLLAGVLAEKGMLTSRMLRNLEPYIIGLAPPAVDVSWNDFVRDYLKTHQSKPV